jgi:hypothetical protein
MIGASMTTRNIRRTGIVASKKGKPNPGYPHLSPIVVDDPYAIDPGDKITAVRNTRRDPLAALHVRKQIDEAQYQAGRAFQSDFEVAERGPQAIDPSKEAVDGGRMPEPITEGQRKAVLRLNRAERELGADGAALTHAVLIVGQSCASVASSRGLSGERWERYFAIRFRECLDRLALLYGFAMEKRI